MFLEKYKPQLKDFPQDAVLAVQTSLQNLRKPILLYGSAGCGKTSLIYTLASSLGWEVIELNASDFRNKKTIASIAGGAINQKSLSKKGKIILIDELNGLSSKDRGCLQEIFRLVRKSRYPVIFTANTAWDKKLNSVRYKCLLIHLKRDFAEIKKILQKTSQKQKLGKKEEELLKIAVSSSGDIRAAITDLEYSKSEREKSENIFSILEKIFKLPKEQAELALDYLEKTDLNFEEFFLWIDENLALNYKGEELERAYNLLSKADILRKRIRRRQYWRLLAYINTFLTAGIASAGQTKITTLKKSTRLLKIFWANRRNQEKKDKAAEIAKLTHTSAKKVMQQYPLYEKFL